MTGLYKIVEKIRQLLDIDDKKDHKNIHLMLSIFHALDKWVTFFNNDIKPNVIMFTHCQHCAAKLYELVYNKLYKLSRFFGDHP